MSDKPSVLFVCVHNAGRSQMTAGYLNHLAGGRCLEPRRTGKPRPQQRTTDLRRIRRRVEHLIIDRQPIRST